MGSIVRPRGDAIDNTASAFFVRAPPDRTALPALRTKKASPTWSIKKLFPQVDVNSRQSLLLTGASMMRKRAARGGQQTRKAFAVVTNVSSARCAADSPTRERHRS
jgi:hypothetical protein